MSLKLYFHPLASFCHKVLIAFYENDIPFEPVVVDLADETSSAAFGRSGRWPRCRSCATRPEIARSRRRPSSSSTWMPPTPARPVPAHGSRSGLADAHVGPLLRPLHPGADAEDRDRSAASAGQERPLRRRAGAGQLRQAYAVIERETEAKPWMMGDVFRWTVPARPRSSMPSPFLPFVSTQAGWRLISTGLLGGPHSRGCSRKPRRPPPSRGRRGSRGPPGGLGGAPAGCTAQALPASSSS